MIPISINSSCLLLMSLIIVISYLNINSKINLKKMNSAIELDYLASNINR